MTLNPFAVNAALASVSLCPTTFGISTVFSLVPAADPLLMITSIVVFFSTVLPSAGSWLMICPFSTVSEDAVPACLMPSPVRLTPVLPDPWFFLSGKVLLHRLDLGTLTVSRLCFRFCCFCIRRIVLVRLHTPG